VSETRRGYWSKLVAEQETSRQSVRQFCRERGIGEHSFYQWRRRLRASPPVRFALLETRAVEASGEPATLELVLTNGERLRINNGVSAAVLRMVLEAVRG
jgi:transposase-like protein